MRKGGSPRSEFVREDPDVGRDHRVEQDDLMQDDAVIKELLAIGVEVDEEDFGEFEFADEEDDEFGPEDAADDARGHEDEAERDEGAGEVGDVAEDEMSLSEGDRWENESEEDGEEEGEDYDAEAPVDGEGESDPLFMSDEFRTRSRRQGVFAKLCDAGRQLTSVNVLMGMFIGIAIFVGITMFASGAWLMTNRIHRNVWHDSVASTASAATPSVATPVKVASSGEASAKSGGAVGDVAAAAKKSSSVDVDAGHGEPAPNIPVPVNASKPIADNSKVEEPPSGQEPMVEPEVASKGGVASAERVVGGEQRPVAAANGDPSSRDGVVKAYEKAMQDDDRVVGSVPASGDPTPTAGGGPATQPQSQNLNPGESRALIALAKTKIGKGDIPSGRLILERAAELQDSNAAFLLGETYDIIVLGRSDARSVLADPEKAEHWYRKAAEYGSVEARRRLLRP